MEDSEMRGLISSAVVRLREGRWFILVNMPGYSRPGMVSPAAEDVLSLIETHQL